MSLSGPVAKAASGQRRAVVVLLHGFGADGADLIGLAGVMADHLPDVEFRSPNAPEPCSINPMGRQWFPIPRMDGSTEAQRAASMARSLDLLNGYLDGVLAETGLAPARLALMGFSQGTMMSLHVAPRRAEALAGVVGFSGMLLAPERLAAEAVSHPPVLLVHGDRDDVVPFASLETARAGLDAAGIPVRTHVSRGAAHSIAPDGLGAALGFLRPLIG